MNDRRQTTDLTGRRINSERRKDAETRKVFDVLGDLASRHAAIHNKRWHQGLDSYTYGIETRLLIEDAAKKIRVIQEKESHEPITVGA